MDSELDPKQEITQTSRMPSSLDQPDTVVSSKAVEGATGNNSDEFPEGGLQAWAAVCGSFCITFMSQGSITAFGVYQDFYTRIYLNEHTPSQIAWIGSVQIFLIFLIGLPAGKLFDEGYFRIVMVTGCFIYVFSYFMLSLAKPHHYYQVFLAQGLGVGIGMGLIYVPGLSLIFHYFKRRRLLASGLGSVGSAVGAICQTIGLNHLFNGPIGFAWGVRIYGAIFLVLAVVGNLLMHPRLPPRKLRKDNLPPPDIKRVATDIPLVIAIFGSSLVVFSIYFPYFYLQLFAIIHGIPTSLSFYSITILNGAAAVGRAFFGAAGDRYGPLNAMVVALTLLVIVSFSMVKVTNERGLIPFTIFYGFLSSSYLALSGPCVSSFVENTSELGFAFGYSCFIISFFALVAQPIVGQVIDAPKYKWNDAIICASVVLVGGVVLAFISRTLLVRRTKTWKV